MHKPVCICIENVLFNVTPPEQVLRPQRQWFKIAAGDKATVVWGPGHCAAGRGPAAGSPIVPFFMVILWYLYLI